MKIAYSSYTTTDGKVVSLVITGNNTGDVEEVEINDPYNFK